MVCKFCQAEINDEAAFCPNCGQPSAEQTNEGAQQKSNNFISAHPVEIPTFTEEIPSPITQIKGMINFETIAFIVGTFLILIGFARLFGSSVTISPVSFGADYYTYAYRGIIECAELLSKINGTVSWLIIAVGAAIDLKALKMILKK